MKHIFCTIIHPLFVKMFAKEIDQHELILKDD
ncbi:hypothetical protein J2S05_003313 [Alkalicoccobacillus murimartini]|uniref:Uncharacterized protein n=1 Tax=Alkalicoccobacillus murimartini TaxID=171685 RepID=A0ABT9YKV5_9BACI|nr:hypothetical protein [Alkalicoccobacillus murimartini]